MVESSAVGPLLWLRLCAWLSTGCGCGSPPVSQLRTLLACITKPNGTSGGAGTASAGGVDIGSFVGIVSGKAELKLGAAAVAAAQPKATKPEHARAKSEAVLPRSKSEVATPHRGVCTLESHCCGCMCVDVRLFILEARCCCSLGCGCSCAAVAWRTAVTSAAWL